MPDAMGGTPRATSKAQRLGQVVGDVAYDTKNPDTLYITEAETGSRPIADLNMIQSSIGR